MECKKDRNGAEMRNNDPKEQVYGIQEKSRMELV